MNLIVINGSPRKNGNTSTLLKEVIAGAKAQDAETELINLYDLEFTGCKSCFACKRLGGKSYGKCAVNDGLASVFKKIEQADAIVMGTPIYWSGESGVMRSFLERFLFQYMIYDKTHTSLAPKNLKTALVFTMNVDATEAKGLEYDRIFKSIAGRMQHFFGSSTVLTSYNTYQFDDYSKYETSVFNLEEKTRQRDEQFPLDKEKAFQLGYELANQN